MRPAQRNDIMQCVEIGRRAAEESGYPALFGAEFDRDHVIDVIIALMNHQDAIVLVAEYQGKLVGMLHAALIRATFAPDAPVGHCMMIYVDKAYRKGTGAGIKLIKAFEAAMRGLGARVLEIGAHHRNPELVVLYERMGYGIPSSYRLKLCR